MRFPKRAWLIVIVSACTLAPLAAGILWITHRVSLYQTAAATLPDEIKVARQEGLPLRAEDLARTPPVPDEQNAAPYYRRIAQLNKTLQENASVTNVAKGKATSAERQAAERLLAQAAPQLKLVEQAALLPDCDFHRNWRLGPNLTFPEYASMRSIARLLAAQATLQSDAGHPEAALHTIWIGARMAHHIGEEPDMIALLVRIAVEAIMDRPFQRILKRYGNRADILRIAAHAEQAFGTIPDVWYALGGEVVMCRIMAQMIRSNNTDLYDTYPTIAMLPPGSRTVVVVADAAEAHSLSFWRRVHLAVNPNRDDPMATYLAWKAVEDANEALSMTTDGKQKPTYEFAAILSPYFASAQQKVMINEAQRRLRRTMLALLKDRLRHGRFPTTLAGLAPPAPADPFLNHPLHYRPTATGFVLYSVGVNLIDDGGEATPLKEGEPPPDIVVSFP